MYIKFSGNKEIFYYNKIYYNNNNMKENLGKIKKINCGAKCLFLAGE